MANTVIARGWHWATDLGEQGWQYTKDTYQKFFDYRYRRVQRQQQPVPRISRDVHLAIRKPFWACIVLVSSILFVNVCVAIWAGAAHKIEDGLVVTLYKGECSTTSAANFGVHLVINIFASALFAASTYVMQRLGAPTRRDLDAAHSEGDSLMIGSLAVTNFAILSRKRLIAFLLLWCSSLPLHLMYNGLIEQTTTNAEWSDYVLMIQESAIPLSGTNSTMLKVPERTQQGVSGYTGGEANSDDVRNLAKWLVTQKPSLQRLEVPECIQAYSTGESLTMGDVLMVVASDIDTSLYSYGYEGTFPANLVKWPNQLGTTNPFSSIEGPSPAIPWYWICGDPENAESDPKCNPVQVTESGKWIWSGERGLVPIDHCLARKFSPSCELNMSIGIMIAVLICNLGKLAAMVIGVFICTDRPLITIGDAISSFLEEEDVTTKGLSVATKEYFPGFWNDNTERTSRKDRTRAIVKQAQRKEEVSKATGSWHPWFSKDAKSTTQTYREVFREVTRLSQNQDRKPWIVRGTRLHTVGNEMEGAYAWSNIIGISLLAVVSGFFGFIIHQTRAAYHDAGYPMNFSVIWQLGLGTQPSFLSSKELGFSTYAAATSASRAYISGTVLANTPQLALSALYLFYNNFFTRVFMAFEFTSYHTHRRGLRVSFPAKDSAQRGSYFLQFPLRYSLLMIAYFAVTHTFLSESLFLKRTYAIYPLSFTNGNDVGKYLVSRIGFSLLGTFFLTILLFALVAFSVGVGFWRRDWVLPVTNGESRSISAMCHPPEGQQDVQLTKVRWGVTGMRKKDGELVGHCSFSSRPVRIPEVGEKFW